MNEHSKIWIQKLWKTQSICLLFCFVKWNWWVFDKLCTTYSKIGSFSIDQWIGRSIARRTNCVNLICAHWVILAITYIFVKWIKYLLICSTTLYWRIFSIKIIWKYTLKILVKGNMTFRFSIPHFSCRYKMERDTQLRFPSTHPLVRRICEFSAYDGQSIFAHLPFWLIWRRQ